jgi:hypothetical protein
MPIVQAGGLYITTLRQMICQFLKSAHSTTITLMAIVQAGGLYHDPIRRMLCHFFGKFEKTK